MQRDSEETSMGPPDVKDVLLLTEHALTDISKYWRGVQNFVWAPWWQSFKNESYR